MKMMPQQYCLRWKHHHTNVQNMFAQLLEKVPVPLPTQLPLRRPKHVLEDPDDLITAAIAALMTSSESDPLPERFCDVTLYCSPSFATQVPNKDTVDPQNIHGVSLRAHRVVLAACSELLGALLGAHEAHGEPVLVIDGAEPRHLKALLDYMYTGEMNVHHSQLASLLKTAEELRIKGLTDIRWNNKDEPPDCEAGVIATATPSATEKLIEKQEKPAPKQVSPKQVSPKQVSPKQASPKQASPKQASPKHILDTPELRCYKKREHDGSDSERHGEKFNVNGGPPPLIKLPMKEKNATKRDNSDTDSPSPKRQRFASGTEHTDDESLCIPKTERDLEWQHGNLDITAERVVGWGMGEMEPDDSSRDASDDEWADAPTDIGSFLHTRLRVDGDNSADEESNDSGAGPACRSTAASSSSSVAASSDIKLESPHSLLAVHSTKQTLGLKSGPTDPRFTDVVKLSDYLQHGRRPQFWEENYVKRVMEAVRLKELEMKQAAEILGVSYGTLYGRYRDVYGCINRPYRTVRDFWQAKGPSEVMDRLQRGEVSLEAAAQALGVTIANLAAHVADFGHGANSVPDFEPIPIEVDPSLKIRSRSFGSASHLAAKPPKKPTPTAEKPSKKVMIGSLTDEDPIPATVITTHDGKPGAAPAAPATPAATPSGKWPSIRVASIDTLRGGGHEGGAAPPACPPAAPPSAAAAPASPSQLMRTRPDLTIVAARKPDARRDGDDT